MPIEHFKLVDKGEILLNGEDEMPIKTIVAVNERAYWQSFVYVEVRPKSPTGLYPHITPNCKTDFDYAWEEYGVFENHFVTRAEYDDGAAVINGKPCRIDGVQLRVRYLTPYNFIIAPHETPINNTEFELRFKELMNGILNNKYSVEDLSNEVLKLPKNNFLGSYD